MVEEDRGGAGGQRATHASGQRRGQGLVTHVPSEAEEVRAAARREREAEREAEGAAERVKGSMDGRQERFDGRQYWEKVRNMRRGLGIKASQSQTDSHQRQRVHSNHRLQHSRQRVSQDGNFAN